MICLAVPINGFHATGDIQKFLLRISETNTWDVLPMCQDKFGHVDWNPFWSHYTMGFLGILFYEVCNEEF